MAGTKAGGKAAAATNKSKYGADFYAKIGAAGGKKGHTGGFSPTVSLPALLALVVAASLAAPRKLFKGALLRLAHSGR
jgi:hypothetical protein